MVDKDHFEDADAKVVGPRSCKLTADEIKLDPASVPFRMFDDDGNLMYSGWFLGDAGSEDAFGPLEDYGTPNAGCTYIEYRKNGRSGPWEQL